MAAAAAAALGVTAAVAVVPTLQFAYRSLPAHVAMETAASLIAGLAATLAYVRSRRSGAPADLLLLGTLVLLALTNSAFSLLPALTGATGGAFATWAPVAGRFIGGLGFLAAAYAPTGQAADPRLATRRALLASIGTAAAIALVVAALGDALPDGVDVERRPSAAHVSLDGHPLILVLHVVSASTYTAAALGFLRRRDRLPVAPRWLAVAMVLAAGARVNYFLHPSLYSEYVYAGDALRTASYAVLLFGSLVEILRYERRLAELAILEERRRLARDLHDGLAQELAFITSQSRRLRPGAAGDEVVQGIVRSAQRALRESREAISALARPLEEPLADTLRRAAEYAARGEAEVDVHAPDVAIGPQVREALTRIVAEATHNAVRHGRARTVAVRAEGDGGLRVSISDDGAGFDPAQDAPAGSFGLIAMRERAEAVGGRLEITSRPGEGTRIEVRLDA